jgi:hypothetical protein
MIRTPDDERIFDGAEDEMGNFYMVGRKYSTETSSGSAFLVVLNSDGQLVYEHEYFSEDSSSYFGSVYFKNDSIIIIGVKRSNSVEYNDGLWMLILDNEFNILKNKTYFLPGYNIVDLESIVNHNNNYVICGMLYLPPLENDIFFFEISESGDSVNQARVALEGQQLEFDLIEKKNGGYKVFAYGSFPGSSYSAANIVEFDSLFNYISVDSIPYYLYFNHSAKWLNDSTYLITGNKRIYSPLTRTDIGIIKLNSDDDFIMGNHFGKTDDTVSYVGACSNLDFITPENILFGGASNIIPEQGLFQNEVSWLMLTNIDTNLNLNWQMFYGGDAAYYLWGLKATQDGGCLMMATRYDADIQDQELDIYILKVDANGLLTSTGEGLQIPVQQLAFVPNPARDFVSVRYPDIFGYEDKEIEVFNSLGMQVFKVSATQDLSETRLDVTGLPAGLYFVVLKVDGKKVGTGKMLKI